MIWFVRYALQCRQRRARDRYITSLAWRAIDACVRTVRATVLAALAAAPRYDREMYLEYQRGQTDGRMNKFSTTLI